MTGEFCLLDLSGSREGGETSERGKGKNSKGPPEATTRPAGGCGLRIGVGS